MVHKTKASSPQPYVISLDFSAETTRPKFPGHAQHMITISNFPTTNNMGCWSWQLLPKRIHIRTVLTNTRVVGCIFPPSADVQELQLIFVLLAYYIAPTSNGDV